MRRAAAILLAMLALAGCGSTATSSDPPSPATASASSAAAVTTVASKRHHASKPQIAIRVANTSYGRVLVDARGFALYLFTHDPRGATRCGGACAAAWPPYVVNTGRLAAQGDAQTAFVGTIRRPDGRLQVTYRGHPLYYYVGDRRPHQVLCQGVTEYGGTWYVVAPSGAAVR